MNPLHIWLQYVFLWQYLHLKSHLQLQQDESSSYHGSGKYRKDARQILNTSFVHISYCYVSERTRIPTECWTFKILTILIPQTSVITHEDRSKKSPFNVVVRLVRKITGHCLSSLIFLPKSLMWLYKFILFSISPWTIHLFSRSTNPTKSPNPLCLLPYLCLLLLKNMQCHG